MIYQCDKWGEKKQKHLHSYCLLASVVPIQLCCLCNEWICIYSLIIDWESQSVNISRSYVTSLSLLLPQAMVETVNNLLHPRAKPAWRELPTSEQLQSATLLLDTVETGAFMLADNLLKTDTVQETTDYIREYILSLFSPPSPLSDHATGCPCLRHLTNMY